MLRQIARITLRVPNISIAVQHYTHTLGLKLARQDALQAELEFPESGGELILHTDTSQPAERAHYLVEDVRSLYERRSELNLNLAGPPRQTPSGWQGAINDPFGTVSLILDRSAGPGSVEGMKPMDSGAMAQPPARVNRPALVEAFTTIGRTADDLPYTPEFEAMWNTYTTSLPDPKPSRAETWRQLLNLRKGGKLPKFREHRPKPPEIPPAHRDRLRQMLGTDIGKRDRLPYSPRFDILVEAFNKTQVTPLSPHAVWRLVATLAK